MKTVRIVGQGIPARLSNEDAAVIVGIGDGEYAPKSVWKHEWAVMEYWAQRGGREAFYNIRTVSVEDYKRYAQRIAER